MQRNPKIKFLKSLHKSICVATILIISLTIAAAKDNELLAIKSDSFSTKIVNQIKNIFSNTNGDAKVSPQNQTTTTSQTLATSTYYGSATSSYLLFATSTTLTTSTNFKCTNEEKINNKKEKIKEQIKTQIKDKNRLIEGLNSLASSSQDEETNQEIDEKIMELETDMAYIITRQKDLLVLLSSTTDQVCDKVNSKTIYSTSTESKIKDLENSISKKNIEINNLIKVDLKNLIENLD